MPILEAAFAWTADFEYRSGEPLRIATLALDALKAAGIAWTDVFVGVGVSTIGAAVSAGVTTAALGRCVAPHDVIDAGAKSLK